MPILISCGCGATLRTPDAAAGQAVRCPNCQAVHPVPAPPKPATPPRVTLVPVRTAAPLPRQDGGGSAGLPRG